MTVPKGGRGLKAPYETTHIRIPVPIKDAVLKMSQRFKEVCMNGEVVPFTDDFDFQTFGVSQTLSKDDAVQKARDILKAKKGAKVSMEKLLTAIYGDDVVL